jgi:uncharacterized OsmC-like protein
MDLRATQQPLKDAYRMDPEKAQITLTARGSDSEDDPISCSVDIGRMIYEAQAHPGVGGAGTGACSGDLLLGALAACAQLTCQMVATAMGLTREVGAGFHAIRVRFEVDAPEASEEELDALHRKAERYCTVFQTLANRPAELTTEMAAARPA